MLFRSRSRWVTRVTEGMRPAWAESVDHAVPDHDAISAALLDALDGVPISVERSVGARRARLLGWVAAAVALLGALVCGAFAMDVIDIAAPGPLVAVVVTLVAAVTSVTSLVVSSRMRARLAEQRAEQVREAAFAALRGVVETTLAAPAQQVLTEHRHVRESALSAREFSSTGRLVDAAPPALV